MDIRNAAPEDLATVRRLLAACELPQDDLSPAHMEHFWIGHDGEGLVGTVGLESFGRVVLLRSLAVAPRYRGREAGARLVEQAEEHARQQETEAIYLLTTTAARYFERRGYEPVRRTALPEAIRATEQVARLCPSSATCMAKRLARDDA